MAAAGTASAVTGALGDLGKATMGIVSVSASLRDKEHFRDNVVAAGAAGGRGSRGGQNSTEAVSEHRRGKSASSLYICFRECYFQAGFDASHSLVCCYLRRSYAGQWAMILLCFI